MNNTTELPETIGGYQHLAPDVICQEGDIYVRDGKPYFFVYGCIGESVSIAEQATECRVYRRIPCPKQGGGDDTGIAKTEFSTGATRSDATNRGRFDLIPYEAMLSLARRYELGADRFGDRNWEKGQPLSRLLSSMRRHAFQTGQDFSEDHIGAVMWNAAAFATMVARMEAGTLPKTLDDIGYFSKQEAQP
jgi:hypothetical protein